MAQLGLSNFGGRQNVIINGAFDIWQRGTSFPAITTNSFFADRWAISQSNDAVITAVAGTHQAMLGDNYINYAGGIQVTTADTSISSSQFCTITQPIEGYLVRTLIGKPITISFYVYSTLPGIYCVRLANSGSDRTYVAEYTINQASTWEKKSVTLTMHDALSGTWNFTTGVGLFFSFILSSGTNYHGTANTWNTSNKLSTNNQVNFLQSVSNQFYLSQIQIELGTIATPYIYKPYHEELILCQRYYEADITRGIPAVVYSSPYTQASFIGYKVTKRTSTQPVLSSLSFVAFNNALGTSPVVYSYQHSIEGFAPIFTSTSPTNGAGGQAFYSWTSSAELL